MALFKVTIGPLFSQVKPNGQFEAKNHERKILNFKTVLKRSLVTVWPLKVIREGPRKKAIKKKKPFYQRTKAGLVF